MAELAVDKHVKYILAVEKNKDSFESVVMDHLRMNGAYWGLTALDLLGKLDSVNVDEVISWILKCQHESGGFSGNIGHDPHILYTLSAVQVLALFNKLDVLDIDKVCYSWWVLSSLIMIDRVHWIDKEKLVKFILDCQDVENGGISDRPDDAVDVYHTYFGVAGLSLLNYPGLKAIDPAYALPVDVVNRIFFSG
uniref:Prenyltransferase alpha-alpha toroid domain-containing protein n=1 Tax=Gossypium raimondii TaxID=29730 RepID=A0A0D2PWN9_GOSRA|nr:hypothetical protein B456_005G208400 [Gossypium raimondii]